MGDTAPLWIVAILLLVLSGFFSSMETAYSCLNKLKLKTMVANGNKKAEKVLRLAESYDKLLSTILVGNNIVNITTTALVGLLFAEIIKDNPSLATTYTTIFTTIAVLIFGETTPKMLAKVYPEKFAMGGYPLLKFFSYLLYPINIIFSGYKFLLSKIFKLKNEEVVTEEEIITMVEEAREDGTLKQDESKLIRSVIDFDDLEVGDIFIPRVNIVAIDINTPLDSIKNTFQKKGLSRLPVYKGTIDSIVGILHEKDFYNTYLSDKKDLTSALHEVIYTTEHTKIAALLKLLQKKKTHMAIVLDEYGGTMGIITLEDILEELVGEIWDEHDSEINYFKQVSDTETLVNAQVDLSDFFNYFNIDETEHESDANTLSGWIIEQLGDIPRAGTKFDFENLSIQVIKASVKKIFEAKVTVLSSLNAEKDESEPKNRKAKNETV